MGFVSRIWQSRPAACNAAWGKAAHAATTAPSHVSGGPTVVEIDYKWPCRAGILATGPDGSQLFGLAVYKASGNSVTRNVSSITLADNGIGVDLVEQAEPISRTSHPSGVAGVVEHVP